MNPPFLDWCQVCGKRIQKKGKRWTHMRPQPDGSPNDHNAKPGGSKKSS